MTVPVPNGSRPWGVSVRGRGRIAPALLGLSILSFAEPAVAQVGAVVSIFSDARFRGISISDGRPVGTFDLSYDAKNGIYGAMSASGVATRNEGLRALGISLNGGFAKRLRSGLTADIGVVHSRYSHYSALSPGRNYTEVYAGLTGRNIGGRISVSPNYLGAARWTVHGELNGHVDLTERLLLEGEIGLLSPLGRSAYETHSRPQLDGRLGLAQRFSRFTLHAAITSRSGGLEIYSGKGHSATALIVGISYAL